MYHIPLKYMYVGIYLSERVLKYDRISCGKVYLQTKKIGAINISKLFQIYLKLIVLKMILYSMKT